MTTNISKDVVRKEYAMCTKITESGEMASKIYLIVEGQVSLVLQGNKGKSRAVMTLGKFDLIGEELLARASYRYTAIAVTSVAVMVIDKDKVLELLKEGDFARSFMYRLTRKQHALAMDNVQKAVELDESAGEIEMAQAALGMREEKIGVLNNTVAGQQVEISTMYSLLDGMARAIENRADEDVGRGDAPVINETDLEGLGDNLGRPAEPRG